MKIHKAHIIYLFTLILCFINIQGFIAVAQFQKLLSSNAAIITLEYADSSIIDNEAYYNSKISIINSYIKLGEFSKARSELDPIISEANNIKNSNGKVWLIFTYLEGEIDYNMGKYLNAKTSWEQCLENIKTPNQIYDSIMVLSLKGLGNIELKAGNSTAALENYSRAKAVELKRNKGTGPLLGSLYLNMALAFEQLTVFDSADVYFLKSIQIKKKYAEDQNLLASSYANYSNYLIQFGKIKKALFYLNLADSLYRSKHGENFYRLAYIYLNYAKVHMLNNEYRQALYYYIKSENIYMEYLPENDKKFESIKSDIALLYKYLSRYEKSIEIYNSPTLAKSDNPITQVVCLRNIGECHLLLGNTKEAGYFAREALKKSILLFGINHIQTATCYLSYSNYNSMIGDKVNAENCLNTALGFFTNYFGKNNREVTNVYNFSSKNYLELKTYYKAATAAQKAIISITPGFTDTSIFVNPDFGLLQNDYHAIAALTLKTRALVELMLAHPTKQVYAVKALETALLGIRLFETFRTTLDEENSKMYTTEKVNTLFPLATYAAWQIFTNTNNPEYLDIAFQQAGKNKATILASGMKTVKGLDKYIPEPLAREEKNIKQELRALNSLIHEENNKDQQDSARIGWLQNKLFNKYTELDSLMKYISKNYQKYFDLTNTYDVASLKDIENSLTKDEALLEYVMSEDFLFLFVVKNNEVKVRKIDLDTTFRNTIKTYLSLLHTPPSFDVSPKELIHEYSLISYEIYQKLIGPVESLIKNKELIIIPDDVLGYLPFESLITSPYNESFKNFRELPYMVKEYPISYHYSSSLFLNSFITKLNHLINKALVMAPSYRINGRNNDSTKFGHLPILKFTKNEAEVIHQLVGGKIYVDSSATERNFKNNASNFSILHLAMHTILDDEDPMSSKLIFSQNDDPNEDGLLNTYEIYDLALDARMVVLSACETGSGTLRKGEGIMNMARGFLFAGVPSLLITHWKVNDASSSQIMKGYYSSLQKGKSKALQESKLVFISGSDLVFAHPYYWSAYVIIGDVSPIKGSKMKMIISLIGLVLIGIITLYFLRKKS
ncbi:MAG: CHAT domain-containing protein [Bacteroidales bacterium]|nr:CHAT domain-containing protein [Bacteroidales bacterium]MCF8402815.1 CHAT domain-containing protein [Bacteroidales bacterium]